MDREQVVRCLLAERSKILGFINVVLGDWDGVEDVFQDACVLALAKSASINDEAHLQAWLRITCRNLVREAIRIRNRVTLLDDPDVMQCLERFWREQDERAGGEVFDHLSNCVEQLSPRAREMIRQRYTTGMSIVEIAEHYQRPLNTIYVGFSRIYAALADCIDLSRRPRPRSRSHA